MMNTFLFVLIQLASGASPYFKTCEGDPSFKMTNEQFLYSGTGPSTKFWVDESVRLVSHRGRLVEVRSIVSSTTFPLSSEKEEVILVTRLTDRYLIIVSFEKGIATYIFEPTHEARPASLTFLARHNISYGIRDLAGETAVADAFEKDDYILIATNFQLLEVNKAALATGRFEMREFAFPNFRENGFNFRATSIYPFGDTIGVLRKRINHSAATVYGDLWTLLNRDQTGSNWFNGNPTGGLSVADYMKVLKNPVIGRSHLRSMAQAERGIDNKQSFRLAGFQSARVLADLPGYPIAASFTNENSGTGLVSIQNLGVVSFVDGKPVCSIAIRGAPIQLGVVLDSDGPQEKKGILFYLPTSGVGLYSTKVQWN